MAEVGAQSLEDVVSQADISDHNEDNSLVPQLGQRLGRYDDDIIVDHNKGSNHERLDKIGNSYAQSQDQTNGETVTFDQGTYGRDINGHNGRHSIDVGIDDNANKNASNEDEVFIDQDIPIQFEKRTIPKPRTQSVQSVLSSVSLRSLANQSLMPSSKKAFVAPPQQQSVQPQFIHANTHIQAPAIAASSKRRASFEIGQRLPFNKDENTTDDIDAFKEHNEESLDFEDGETTNNAQDNQNKLTDDALKRLASFSKFIPAEADINMTHTNNSHSVESNEEVKPVLEQQQQRTGGNIVPPTLDRKASSSSISPEFNRINMKANGFMNPSTSIPSSLARNPVSNPSLASIQRAERPQFSSNGSTSNYNLSTMSLNQLPDRYTQQQQQQYFQHQHQQQQQQQHQQPISTTSRRSSQLTNLTNSNSRTTSTTDIPRITSPNSLSSATNKKHFDQESLQTLSDPKRPMYVPAVLRQSGTNLKSEDLKHINEQNSKLRSRNSYKNNIIADAASSLRSQTSHWRLAFDQVTTGSNGGALDQQGPNGIGAGASSRRHSRSQGGSAPTRAHWRKDQTRSGCASCGKQFTFFERRHHCRHCGDIFCAEHTSNFLKLGPDAQFTVAGMGVLSKVCDACYGDYKEFLKEKFGQDAAKSVSRKGSVGTGAKGESGDEGNAGRKSGQQQDGSVQGGTVPADWTWSSF